MRVDYFHTGGPGGEAVTLDAVVSEGAWPGSRTQLIDTTNLGRYIFEVIDRRSNRVLYSRGFASIYGEWETTPEFRTTNRTFHESLRFPLAGRAGSHRHQETRSPERVPAVLDDRGRSSRPQSPRACIPPSVERLDAVRERPAEPQSRSSAHQRRLLADAGCAVSRRRRAARRGAVRTRAVQIAPRGFQRAGHCRCPARRCRSSSTSSDSSDTR